MRINTDKKLTEIKPKIKGQIRSFEHPETYIEVSSEDFAQGSLVYRWGTSNSGEITVGGAILGSCNFKLWNDSGKFDSWNWTNSVADFTVDIDGTEIYMGMYFVVAHTETGDIISVECLDPLKFMDEHQIYELNVNYPIDAVDLLKELISLGITNINVEGLDDARGLELSDPGDDTMTNRDAISYIAQALGKWVIFRGSGADHVEIKFGWYDVDNAHDAGTTFSHNLRTDDVNITGVTITAKDDETTDTRGDDSGYSLNISNNPFITSDNINTVADRISKSVIGLNFCPGTVSILSDPNIEAGDVLKIATRERKDIIFPATSVTYKPGYIQQQITADAESADGDLQVSKKDYIKKVVNDMLKDPDSELSQAIGSGGEGGGGEEVKGRTPAEAYKDTRPAEWLTMPEPSDNEIYILCIIPPEVSAFVGLHIETDDGSPVTVAYGTVENGTFVQKETETPEKSEFGKCISAADFAEHKTAEGFSQCMIKITGNNIKIFQNSNPDGKPNFTTKNWNIVEICAKLPNLETMSFAQSTQPQNGGLYRLQYFTLRGSNNISKWEEYCFRGLPNLKVIRELDTSKAETLQYAFAGCSSLISLPVLDISTCSDCRYMFNNDPVLEYAGVKNTGAINDTVAIDMSNMFYNCEKLMTVSIDTSHTADAYQLLRGCASLTKMPDISLPKTKRTQSMFYDCTKLKKIGNITADQATDATMMFRNCQSLEEIGNVNVNNATNVNYMFYDCKALKKTGKISIDKATSATYIFQGCQKLEDIPNINLSGVKSLNYAFADCLGLTDIGDLDVSGATSLNYMFTGCYNIVNIGNIKTDGSHTVDSMFSNCRGLLAADFDFSGVTSCSSLFNNCYGLTAFSLRNISGSLNIASVITATGLTKMTFENCAGWTGSAITPGATNMTRDGLLLLFNSLPSTSGNYRLTVSNNVGYLDLTDDDKAIATGKGWQLY